MPYFPDAKKIVLRPVQVRPCGFKNSRLRCLKVQSAPNFVGAHVLDYQEEIGVDRIPALIETGLEVVILKPEVEVVSPLEYVETAR